MSSTEPLPSGSSLSSSCPAVSVILVLWNCEAELPRCLQSLLAESSRVPLQVICVDNASEDRSVATARAAGAEVVEMGANTGFPRAVNAGLERATAPNVLLLNPDVELHPGSLNRCLRELQHSHDIGVVGCNLRRSDGSPDLAAARRFRSLSGIALQSFGLTRLSKRLDVEFMPGWRRTTSRDVDCINGAFMLMRTEHIRRLGGLDETVFMYLEDQELCRRTWEEGYRVRFVADASATHIGGASTRRASAERQVLAYLHRTDADIELVARLHGSPARRVAIALFMVRALFGLTVGVISGNQAMKSKYGSTVRWLGRQVRHRVPAPPIP